jgi:hypothetical protein
LPAIVFAFVLLGRSTYFASLLKSVCKRVAVLARGAKRFILKKMPRLFNLQDSNEGVNMMAIVEKSTGTDTLDVSLVT